MRKFVIGLIIGASIMFAFQVSADSLVGKKIDSTLPVYVNGQQLDTPAIVVDGTSFLPVRKISEAIEYDVSYDENNMVVKMENKIFNLTLEEAAERIETLNDIIKNEEGNIWLWSEELKQKELTEEGIHWRNVRIQQSQEFINQKKVDIAALQEYINQLESE